LAIVNEITALIEVGDYSYSDIAILYRCNFQSRVIEESFSQYKIPYHIENGLCFYDRREVKILLDYLKVISNPYSDTGDEALRNIINVPRPELIEEEQGGDEDAVSVSANDPETNRETIQEEMGTWP